MRLFFFSTIFLMFSCNDVALKFDDFLLKGSENFVEVTWKMSISHGLVAIPTDSSIQIFDDLDLEEVKYLIDIPNGIWSRYKQFVNPDSGSEIIRPSEHSASFINRMPSDIINACTILNDSLIAYSITLNYVIINEEVGIWVYGPKLIVLSNFKNGTIVQECLAEFEDEKNYPVHPYNLLINWNPLTSKAIYYRAKHVYDSLSKKNVPGSFVQKREFQVGTGKLLKLYKGNSKKHILSLHEYDLFAIGDSLAYHYTTDYELKLVDTINYNSRVNIIDVAHFEGDYYLLALDYSSNGVNAKIIKHSDGTLLFDKVCDVSAVRFQSFKNDLILTYDIDAQTHIFKIH